MIDKKEKLALKKTLVEKITKYESLVAQSERFGLPAEEQEILKECLNDIKSLDEICKSRNKY